MHQPGTGHWIVGLGAILLVGCANSGGRQAQIGSAQSCMTCHNGAQENNYSGPGLEDPHPFGNAKNLKCTVCHGGNPNGEDKDSSHVPAPPEIGDRLQQTTDRTAYFNRLTLTGIDKYPDYVVDGKTYKALDYLQFINPGDLRVVDSPNRSCGQCHQKHVNDVMSSPLATESGVLSGAMYAIGVDNELPANAGLYEDTAADTGFRDVNDPNFQFDPDNVGAVGSLMEHPVYSVFGKTGDPTDIHNNPLYDATLMVNDLNADNSVVSGSNLANVYNEQIAFTCGDCHLGSAGANNRSGDYRSSGCTACHMPYSLGGRSGSGDPNVNMLEPADPDDIRAPEQSHIRRHLIQSVAKTLPSGEFVPGIDDYSCAGCHQGSNRTVMQYWGIRLDQNADLRDRVQYPADPVTFQTTHNDPRLFDPAVGNREFNGRNANQYIKFEDYDGDGRDDTPADVHYDAGMGCIDCHGSYDVHGGDTANSDYEIMSRMEQAVAITCESCHGSSDTYAPTTTGLDYDDQPAEVGVDAKGNLLRHVTKDAQGNYFLKSRLTGIVHYLPQTLDTVVDSGKTHPTTGDPIYSAMASYAMGRDDGDPATGLGPQQTNRPHDGFKHADSMSCESCHSSWTNTCIGCHLEGEYSTNQNNFSNITGERISFRERVADFVYQSPVPFQLGVGANNKISPISPNTETFFRYKDLQNRESKMFSFSDRNGHGNNQATSPYPALSHNVMMPHSIRGKVDMLNEGPRYCVSCHLTDDGMANFGTEYGDFKTAMANDDFAALDYTLLQTHIGKNPGNQLNSPLWVHMVSGLGSGLFLFDENGCPVNPLDDDANRVGCEGTAPKDAFDPANVALNLDKIVNADGTTNGSSNHPMLNPGQGPNLRDGATDPNMSGPLGATIIRKLTDPTTGVVLDSWVDADGNPQGDAGTVVGGP